MNPFAEFGMFLLHEIAAFFQMRIGCQVFIALRRVGSHTNFLQHLRHLPAVPFARPGRDDFFEHILVRFPSSRIGKTFVRG